MDIKFHNKRYCNIRLDRLLAYSVLAMFLTLMCIRFINGPMDRDFIINVMGIYFGIVMLCALINLRLCTYFIFNREKKKIKYISNINKRYNHLVENHMERLIADKLVTGKHLLNLDIGTQFIVYKLPFNIYFYERFSSLEKMKTLLSSWRSKIIEYKYTYYPNEKTIYLKIEREFND